jgi:hypothetical protein
MLFRAAHLVVEQLAITKGLKGSNVPRAEYAVRGMYGLSRSRHSTQAKPSRSVYQLSLGYGYL